MTPQEFSQKIKTKYPQYANVDDVTLAQKMVEKYPVYASQINFNQPTSGILTPAKEAVQGLQTFYGGGEQGIAQKLAADVQAGAQDIQQGNVVKGVFKSGVRTAGDVAGAIFAPVGAALQATGINKFFDKAGTAIAESSLVNKITDIPAVQNFASAHPNAGEDFSRVLNLAMSGGGGNITAKGLKEVATLPKDIAMATPSAIKSVLPTKESIAQERQAKLNKGFAEQNVRLKSAGKSFNENTKTYTDPVTKNKVTVTPIDTFAEYNIAPVVEKGTIKMGDWKTGEGELGKIKNAVDSIDNQVDSVLTDSQKLHSVDQLEQYTIAKIRNNPDLMAAGKVNSTVAKLKSVFEDYRASFGEELTTTQINEIRKVMNRDWNPDTVDASRAVGDVAREIVYNTTPDLKVKELLRKEGELLAAKKYAETINGTKVVGGRLGNMAMRTAGAIMGATIEKAPVIGPVVGMIGGEYAARALQQTQFKSAWTELKSLLQSNITVPSQSAKMTPKTSIASKYTSQSVKDVGNPVPTITKGVKDYAKNPKLGLSMEDVSNPLIQEANKYKTAEAIKEWNDGFWKINKDAKVVDVPIDEIGRSITIRQKSVTEKGVKEWMTRIENGERPTILAGIRENMSKGEIGNRPLELTILDGNHRLEAYRRLGFKNVPVLDNTPSSQLTDIWKQAHPESNFSPEVQRIINMTQ